MICPTCQTSFETAADLAADAASRTRHRPRGFSGSGGFGGFCHRQRRRPHRGLLLGAGAGLCRPPGAGTRGGPSYAPGMRNRGAGRISDDGARHRAERSPAPPRPIPRPEQRFRPDPERLRRMKQMNQRQPPQRAVFSLQFPWIRPKARALQKCGGRKVARRRPTLGFEATDSKKPAAGSRRGLLQQLRGWRYAGDLPGVSNPLATFSFAPRKAASGSSAWYRRTASAPRRSRQSRRTGGCRCCPSGRGRALLIGW